MKIVKITISFVVGVVTGIVFSLFMPLSSFPNSDATEQHYYDMIYIMYNISQSEQKYVNLYEYYKNGYLYSPWITATNVSAQHLDITLDKASRSRNVLLSENEFAKICGYKLVNKNILVDRYDKRMTLTKIPLDQNVPLTFKRLGFACMFGGVPKNSKLRKNYPSKYFTAEEVQK